MRTEPFDLDRDPLVQLNAWLDEARATNLREPTAMALATVSAQGDPQVRMVLLRGWDERGLTFYTNHESAKGLALADNARAAVVLYWDPLERQVRASGSVERLDRAASTAYFASRPEGSRIAAWASEQSRPIADRAALEARVDAARARFPTDEIPLPPFWGGYLLIPSTYEFWQGRSDRLHDRLHYSRTNEGHWQTQRLMP